MEHVVVEDPDDERIAEYTGLRDHDLRRRREQPGGDLVTVPGSHNAAIGSEMRLRMGSYPR